MKSKIIVSDKDICICCDNECPKNIYDCEHRKELESTKKLKYVWCWAIDEEKVKPPNDISSKTNLA